LEGGEKVKNTIASISLAVVLALGAGAIGCTGEYGPEMTGCTLTVSTTEGGEVTSPGDGTSTYDAGEVVNLIAVAENGYRFANWAGDVSTVADPEAAATTITMNDNYFITANFYEITGTCCTLTLGVSGNGSTSPSVGQHTYAAGTVVPITAAPAAGYRFISWTGSVGTVANVIAATTTITMNADYSIMANFEEGVVTFPDPNFGAALTGPINEEGYIHPSDLQRHSFFSGAT
jgi:hypothetical protein